MSFWGKGSSKESIGSICVAALISNEILSILKDFCLGVELLPGKKYEQEPEGNLHVTSVRLNASKSYRGKVHRVVDVKRFRRI